MEGFCIRIENTEATTKKTEIGRVKFGTESRGEGRWSKGLECWVGTENKQGCEVW